MSTRLGIEITALASIDKMREFLSTIHTHNFRIGNQATLPHRYFDSSSSNALYFSGGQITRRKTQINKLAFMPIDLYKNPRFGNGTGSDYWKKVNSSCLNISGSSELCLDTIALDKSNGPSSICDPSDPNYFITRSRDIEQMLGVAKHLVYPSTGFHVACYRTSDSPKDIILNYTISMKTIISGVIAICSGKTNNLFSYFMTNKRKIRRPSSSLRYLNKFNFCNVNSSPERLREDILEDENSIKEYYSKNRIEFPPIPTKTDFCPLFVQSVEYGLTNSTNRYNPDQSFVRFGGYMRVNLLDLIQYLMIRSILNPNTKYMRIGPKAMMRSIVDELFEWIRLNIVVSNQDGKPNEKFAELFDNEGRTFVGKLRLWYEANQTSDSPNRVLHLVFKRLNIHTNMMVLGLLSTPFDTRAAYTYALETIISEASKPTQTSIMGFSNVKVLDYLASNETQFPPTFYALLPSRHELPAKEDLNNRMSRELHVMAKLKKAKVIDALNNKDSKGIK